MEWQFPENHAEQTDKQHGTLVRCEALLTLRRACNAMRQDIHAALSGKVIQMRSFAAELQEYESAK